MSKYRITLEGKSYEMEIELLAENEVPQPALKREYKEFKSTAKDANVNVIDPSLQKQTVNNTGAVTAPMPGTVIKIEKTTGDEVKAGDLVLILEAMKMENEITAPSDGTVASIPVAKGASVNTGDTLMTFK